MPILPGDTQEGTSLAPYQLMLRISITKKQLLNYWKKGGKRKWRQREKEKKMRERHQEEEGGERGGEGGEEERET